MKHDNQNIIKRPLHSSTGIFSDTYYYGLCRYVMVGRNSGIHSVQKMLVLYVKGLSPKPLIIYWEHIKMAVTNQGFGLGK